MTTAIWMQSNPVVDHVLGLAVHACAILYNALLRHHLTVGQSENEAILIGIKLQQSKKPIYVCSWPGINACGKTHIALTCPRSWDETFISFL